MLVILLMLSYTKLQHLYEWGQGEQSIDLQLITAHRKGNAAYCIQQQYDDHIKMTPYEAWTLTERTTYFTSGA